jgi:hypothetical protein
VEAPEVLARVAGALAVVPLAVRSPIRMLVLPQPAGDDRWGSA